MVKSEIVTKFVEIIIYLCIRGTWFLLDYVTSLRNNWTCKVLLRFEKSYKSKVNYRLNLFEIFKSKNQGQSNGRRIQRYHPNQEENTGRKRNEHYRKLMSKTRENRHPVILS